MSAPGPVPTRALFINGTVGAGKTTTAHEIGTLLQDRGTPYAIIDLDSLRNAWPSPLDDRSNLELDLQNLAAVATNFRSAGPRFSSSPASSRLLLFAPRYEAALGVPIAVCRLVVPLPRLRSRIVARHRAGAERDWHLARIGELDAILQAAQVDDLVVTMDDEPPDVIAARVLAAVGWI
jgi:adenylylsulfate kinase